MKKVGIICAVVLAIALTACGTKENDNKKENKVENQEGKQEGNEEEAKVHEELKGSLFIMDEEKNRIMNIDDLESVELGKQKDESSSESKDAIILNFSEDGTTKLEKLTQENIDKRFDVYVCNVYIGEYDVNETIKDGKLVLSDFSSQIDDLVGVINDIKGEDNQIAYNPKGNFIVIGQDMRPVATIDDVEYVKYYKVKTVSKSEYVTIKISDELREKLGNIFDDKSSNYVQIKVDEYFQSFIFSSDYEKEEITMNEAAFKGIDLFNRIKGTD